MIKSSVKVICDAGPIIHLDEINCLNLLNDFEEIILPFSVEREIELHRPRETGKVRMFLDPPASSDELFKSLKSKLRSQVRKAGKNSKDWVSDACIQKQLPMKRQSDFI